MQKFEYVEISKSSKIYPQLPLRMYRIHKRRKKLSRWLKFWKKKRIYFKFWAKLAKISVPDKNDVFCTCWYGYLLLVIDGEWVFSVYLKVVSYYINHQNTAMFNVFLSQSILLKYLSVPKFIQNIHVLTSLLWNRYLWTSQLKLDASICFLDQFYFRNTSVGTPTSMFGVIRGVFRRSE